MSEKKSIITDTIELMKSDGHRLAPPIAMGGMPPATFACKFSPDGASIDEMNDCGYSLPVDIIEFWSIARTAELFKDQEYGQWGLEILTPQRAVEMTNTYRAERQRDYANGDFVVGQFIGDSDLLMIRCDTDSPDYGNVLVVDPIYPRPRWGRVAESFTEFLQRYAESGGRFFWEETGTPVLDQ